MYAEPDCELYIAGRRWQIWIGFAWEKWGRLELRWSAGVEGEARSHLTEQDIGHSVTDIGLAVWEVKRETSTTQAWEVHQSPGGWAQVEVWEEDKEFALGHAELERPEGHSDGPETHTAGPGRSQKSKRYDVLKCLGISRFHVIVFFSIGELIKSKTKCN